MKRPPPKPRSTFESVPVPTKKPYNIANEHNYSSPIPIAQKLTITRQQLQDAKKQLKVVKQMVKRRDAKIGTLLQEVTKNKLISKDQLDLLHHNFGEKTFQLFDNELKAKDTNKHGHRYSDDLKKFAVTLHFYSSQAYDFLRTYLHLPHPSTIRQWGAGLNCQPGTLTEVITHLKDMVAARPIMAHCMLMLDAMAIKKEVIFEQKTGSYGGFIDCGNFIPADDDSLAKEALVFMAVGLTGNWKFPVAYYLVDHLPGTVQAEIIKQLICSLTEAGLIVHGVVCDGSYANQATASSLGCSISPDSLTPYFSHPACPEEKVYFVFDACHLVKLVRNCLATLGTIYHDDEPISWSYIAKLNDIQQKDNLNLANKLKAKHIQWQRHKMNVKVAVQALSSSVADAIDFLREDLHLPQFAGSKKTTEFIRIIDKLFDYMNSKTRRAKGYKKPMNSFNLTARRRWLMETKAYLSELRDTSGQPLTKGRRKTAWVGFMTTIESVVQISQDLLSSPQPFDYVCTYKMSQDHLEMFFSRIRRRGGWNNNPNALQFKWALRAILQKNSIAPSKNANVSVEEPSNRLFLPNQSDALRHNNPDMQKFAKLLNEPSEFHDHILHYVAGYVSRHVMDDCKCTQCCMALHRNSATPDGISDHTYFADGTAGAFTRRKDRGGLIKPRDDVFRIVKTTDKIFRYSFV